MEEHSIMEEYIVKLIVWALADGLNLKIRLEMPIKYQEDYISTTRSPINTEVLSAQVVNPQCNFAEWNRRV